MTDGQFNIPKILDHTPNTPTSRDTPSPLSNLMTAVVRRVIERVRRRRSLLLTTRARDERQHDGLELAVAVGVEHGIDGRVGVAEDDGYDDGRRGDLIV